MRARTSKRWAAFKRNVLGFEPVVSGGGESGPRPGLEPAPSQILLGGRLGEVGERERAGVGLVCGGL